MAKPARSLRQLEQAGSMNRAQAITFHCICSECDNDDEGEREAGLMPVKNASSSDDGGEKKALTSIRAVVGTVGKLLFDA